MAIPPAQCVKDVALVCTDTRVEIPAIVETTDEGTLAHLTNLDGDAHDVI